MGFYYKYIPKLSLLGQLQTDMGSVLTYVSLLFNKQFKKSDKSHYFPQLYKQIRRAD